MDSFQIPEIAIQHYRKALTNMVCTNYLQDKLPYAFLGVAKSLSYNQADSMQIFQEGVGLWANRKLDLKHEINIPNNIDDCVKLLYDKASDNDKFYLEQAKEVLISMNFPDAAKSLNKKISVLVSNQQAPHISNSEDVEWVVVEKDTFTDVDFKNYGIKVVRKGGSEMIVYFGDEVAKALSDYLEGDRKNVTPCQRRIFFK